MPAEISTFTIHANACALKVKCGSLTTDYEWSGSETRELTTGEWHTVVMFIKKKMIWV